MDQTRGMVRAQRRRGLEALAQQAIQLVRFSDEDIGFFLLHVGLGAAAKELVGC